MKNLIDCPAERAVYFLGGKWKIRICLVCCKVKKLDLVNLKRIENHYTTNVIQAAKGIRRRWNN